MSQRAWSADDEDIQLTYSGLSYLPPGKRPHTPLGALPHIRGPVLGEPGPVQASRGAWPRRYHGVLTGASLGVLFCLGVLQGTVVSGYATSPHSTAGSQPSSSPMLSRPGVNTNTTPATHPGTAGAVPVLAAAVDTRFAIVTLGIACLQDSCDAPDATRYMPAGKRVNALEGGWSCTTLSTAEIVGQRTQTVYCRLDQPNVFTASFDGAPFDCVDSRLGC